MKKKGIITTIVSIAIITIIAGISVAVFASNKEIVNQNDRIILESKILINLLETKKIDTSKPIVIMFHSPRCKACVDFLPAFKKLQKDLGKDYSFLDLNIDEPANIPISVNNVASTPSLYIFDPIIGNKIYLSLRTLGNYNNLVMELDRYTRIRSFIDLEKAKKITDEETVILLEKLQKEQEKNN